ncbi:MAG: GAF domain-containing protein, partial [Microcoleus sp.]
MSTPKSSAHQNNNNSVKSLPTAGIVPTEPDSENLSEPSMEQILEALAAQVPSESAEIERLKTWKQDLERLFQFLGDRRVLIAVM